MVADIESKDGEQTCLILDRHLAPRIGIIKFADCLLKHHVGSPIITTSRSKAYIYNSRSGNRVLLIQQEMRLNVPASNTTVFAS